MADHPLAPPQDSGLLEQFVTDFSIDANGDPFARLTAVTSAFSRIPYENLTKIIKSHENGPGPGARRTPAEVLADHQRWGTGGTCFSLTAALAHLLRAMGWAAEPLLADRSYGSDTHCALLVDVGGRPHIVDPGFLIVRPVPLGTSHEQRIASPFSALVLRPTAGGSRVDLLTEQGSTQRFRLTYKTSPVDPAEFYRAWDASFGWEMMRYPVVTRILGESQLYLRDDYFQNRRKSGRERRHLAGDDLGDTIVSTFGIDMQVVARALSILRRKGGMHGPGAGC